MTGAPPQGGAPPPSPTSSQGQATGNTGATMPVPNRGTEAGALARLAVIVQAARAIAALMPGGSEAARDISDAANRMGKHVPPGSVSQGVMMTEAQRNLMQQRQQQPQIAAMRAAQMGGGAGGGASGAPAGGAPPAA